MSSCFCLLPSPCFPVTDRTPDSSNSLASQVRGSVGLSRKGMMTNGAVCGSGRSSLHLQMRKQGWGDGPSRSGVPKLPPIPPPRTAACLRASVQTGACGGCFRCNSQSRLLQIMCRASKLPCPFHKHKRYGCCPFTPSFSLSNVLQPRAAREPMLSAEHFPPSPSLISRQSGVPFILRVRAKAPVHSRRSSVTVSFCRHLLRSPLHLRPLCVSSLPAISLTCLRVALHYFTPVILCV